MSRSKPNTGIKSRDGLRQVILFEGLENGRLSLSDIDAVMELRDKFLILFEVKKEGIDIPKGQRGMLEAIVDAWYETGRIGMIVKAEHNQNGEFIFLRKCVVVDIYYKGSWRPQSEKITVREFLENFYSKNKIENE